MTQETSAQGPAPPPPKDVSADGMLLQFLENHDAFCPLCKYNLRHLTQPRCPECGRDLKLTVGTTEPHLAAWIMLTISLGCAAGLGSVVTPTLLGPHGLTLFDHLFGYFWISYCVASIPLCLTSILLRRRFCRLPRGTQFAMAAITVGAFAIVVLGFALHWQR